MARIILPETPRYKHDCDECAFLGHVNDSVTGGTDLYYCAVQKLPTVIARFSDKGYDYTSGLVEGPSIEGPLAIAVVRAIRHLQGKLDQIHNWTKR